MAAALGIENDHDGLRPDGNPINLIPLSDSPIIHLQGGRIGITRAVDLPWRWELVGSPWLSRKFEPLRGVYSSAQSTTGPDRELMRPQRVEFLSPEKTLSCQISSPDLWLMQVRRQIELASAYVIPAEPVASYLLGATISVADGRSML